MWVRRFQAEARNDPTYLFWKKMYSFVIYHKHVKETTIERNDEFTQDVWEEEKVKSSPDPDPPLRIPLQNRPYSKNFVYARTDSA